MDEIGNREEQVIRRWANNRVKTITHPSGDEREIAMARFRQMKKLHKFASVHATFHEHFASERHLIDR